MKNPVVKLLRIFLALVIAAASLNPSALGARRVSMSSAQLTARVSTLVRKLRDKPADVSIQNEAKRLGIELMREKRYEDAAELFLALREAVPTDPGTLYGGALALFNLRRIEEAESWARAAVDQSRRVGDPGGVANDVPSSFGWVADILVLLGIILAVKGDNSGSLEVLSRAVEIAPESFDGQFALGRALYGAGDPVGAARAFRMSVALRPTDAQAHFFLCTALEKAGDDKAALAAYREFIAVAPNAAEGHLGLGVLLLKRSTEDLDESIRELEKALALNDKLYEGRVALGRALIRMGRASESILHLKRAAELAPENPEPHYQLAIAYRRLGKTKEADAENAIVRQIHQSRRSAQVSKPEP
jgi:Flp pilus assembly protein TadD